MNNNKKITLSIAIAVALGLSACGDKSSQEYIQMGEKSIENANTAEAIVQFKNAVRIEPKSVAARTHLGLAYVKQGAYANAEKELERALELGASDDSVVVNLALARGKLEDHTGLQLLIDNNSNMSDETYQGVLYYAGTAALDEKDLATGQDLLGQAISIAPESRFGQLSKAYLSYVEKSYAESEQITKALLEKSPEDAEALVILGHNYFAQKNFSAANDTFAKHVKMVPEDYPVLLFQINSLLQAEKFTEAEPLLDKVMSRFKNLSLAHQYKSQIEYHKQNYRDALFHAEEANKGSLEFSVARMIAGVSAYQLNEIEQSYANLKMVEDVLPLTHPVQKLLAIVRVKLGYTDEAAETFNLMEGLTEADVAFLQETSAALVDSNDFNTAKDLLEKAQQLDPENANVAAQKGAMLLSQQDVSGLSSLEQALNIDPSLADVEFSLALQYLRFDQVEKAQSIATEWIETTDKKSTGHLLQGIINTKKGATNDAKEDFETVLTLEPENISALYNLAMLNEKDDVSKAKALYEKLLVLSPSHLGGLNRYSLLQQEQNKSAESITFLEKLLAEDKDNTNLMLGLAQNYRLNNDLPKAIDVLTNIENRDNLPDAYWTILGDSYLQNKNVTLAKTTFYKAIEQFPKNYILHLRYIGVLEIEQAFDLALQAAEQAYKVFPDNTRIEMLIAYYEARNQNIRGSKTYLTKLADKGVEHPFINAIAGQVAVLEKDYEAAVEHFSEAYSLESSAQNAIYLARALRFTGKQKEAEAVLEKHLATEPNVKMRMLLASLYTDNSAEKKIAQYELALQESPDNLIILNNLAWAHYTQNNLAKAKQYISKAYDVKSDYLPVLETYGVILHALNDEQSADILKQAMNAGSTDIKTQLSYAEVLIQQGDNDKARDVLDNIAVKNADVQREISKLRSQI
ncbi:PEP-CTERM system TPR-repeat protein PrsT [Thalassotalea sp. 1_MG-2023]|uniref:XrtA/PEP-CTERM system TPR-repeat protein PrsT n=1 Tax=Thalassotalea sp. 1_MG-2023 TaxID=3062680 RepID=UPI0026E1BD41|nr:XrtA/PEP-CTERM system TPR-repeat protein PrsT [Thalassotalea sp. 1_MG-2023]MDO6425517.1 PEP-CTERM system TPR-repeat protein PrsT [Thalassotalea sp. 1_MG-2023]